MAAMSSYPITPYVLEILSSRICHDLIGPISAVNHGVEFWEEMGSDSGEDAIGLIGHSASQASYRLQLFRLSYASGGTESHVKLDDIHSSFANFIGELRAELDWQLPEHAYEGELPRGYAKTLLNTMMMGVDMLPKGGTIIVKDNPDGPQRSLLIEFISENLAVNIDYKDALDGKTKPENITPRTIHPYLTMAFAQEHNVSIVIEPSDAGLSVVLSHSEF